MHRRPRHQTSRKRRQRKLGIGPATPRRNLQPANAPIKVRDPLPRDEKEVRHLAARANWPVPDRFAAEFMRYFYAALAREGANVTGALRAAQLQARDSALWGSPYYWGAFSLTTTAL
jgi:hypothetical protein